MRRRERRGCVGKRNAPDSEKEVNEKGMLLQHMYSYLLCNARIKHRARPSLLVSVAGSDEADLLENHACGV